MVCDHLLVLGAPGLPCGWLGPVRKRTGSAFRVASLAQAPRGTLPCGAPFPGLIGSLGRAGRSSAGLLALRRSALPKLVKPELLELTTLVLREDDLNLRLGPPLPKQLR